MKLQQFNFLDLKAELDRENLPYKYRLEPTYVNYLKEYNSKSSFEDISFIIKNNGCNLYCPLTIESFDNKNLLSFFGDPFIIICSNINKEILKLFYEKIENILIEKSISKVNFLIEKPWNGEDYVDVINKEVLLKHKLTKFIDLSKDLDSIKKDFSKGHKSSVKKEYEDLNYKIINFKNYNNEILDMMLMHKKVAGRVTRSKNSWLLNGEMIKNDNAILIKVIYKDQAISYSLFFFNKHEAVYFSSCTERQYFKDFINITHKSIYHSINYLKNIKCKKITLGYCKTIYSPTIISEKLTNLEKFRNSFGGDNYLNYYLEEINKKDLINIYES
jgi:hypothetical protein